MLRDYQQEIFNKIKNSDKNSLVQLDTGGGKTHIICAVARHFEYVIIIAHRNILIEQCARMLENHKIDFNLVCNENIKRRFRAANCGNKKYLASVDSVISNSGLKNFNIDTEKRWVFLIDEAHHVTKKNKWGRLISLFKNSRFIGFSATPARTDGKSLGVKNGGIFDEILQAEDLKTNAIEKLLKRGYLSSYKIFSPDFELFLNKKIEERNIINLSMNILDAYKKYGENKKTIVILNRISSCEEQVDIFKKAGISSASMSSKKTFIENERIKKYFKDGRINVIFQVDMLTEGFDMPEVETLIIAKKTNSLIAYRQWIGRVLRFYEGKQAVIVDLVCNFSKHGDVNRDVIWDINSEAKLCGFGNLICCRKCFFHFSVYQKSCENCGEYNDFVKLRSSDFSGYFKLFNLEIGVLEKIRRMRIEEQKKTDEEQKKNKLFFKETLDNNLKKLMEVFCFTLENCGIKKESLNEFLSKKDDEFWYKNFKRKDIETQDIKKFMRIFKDG